MLIRRIVNSRFSSYNFHKEKKKKESPRISGGFKISQVFFEKILPQCFLKIGSVIV